MDRLEFLAGLDELLELAPGTLTGAEVLEELEGWDSLAVISFIAMVDERLGLVIEGQRLAAARTVDDLLGLIGDRLAA